MTAPRIRKAISLTLRHGRLTLAAFALALVAVACNFYNLNLDTSVVSLFPDSSPGLARVGKLIEFSPGARIMFVELSAETASAGNLEKLESAAGMIRAGMDELLYDQSEEMAGLPAAGALLDLLPALCDADMEHELARRLAPEAVTRRLAELRKNLSGQLAFVPSSYLKADPLGLLPLLLERFPDGRGKDGNSMFEHSAKALNGEEFMVSPDGRSILMFLQPASGIHDVYGSKHFMDRLDEALAKAAPQGSGISALAVGGLSFTARNTETIERDLKLTVSLSIVLIALIYLFTVRSLGAVWLLLTPVAAVFFSGSAMSIIWPATAGLALGFGAAVLGLAEDYAVLVHFALRKNRQRKAEALALLARPMTFSAALCISSFCVLMLSGIPALRQLGFFAAFSLLCGLAIALFVLPGCPWMDRPATPQAGPAEAENLRIRPRLVPTTLLAAGCLLLICAGFSLVPFDASFQSLGADSGKLQQEMHELRSRWQNNNEPQTWISSGGTLDEALSNAAALTARLRANANPMSAKQIFSLSDVLPPPAVRMDNLRRWNELVRNHALLPQQLEAAAAANGFKPEAFSAFSQWFSAGAGDSDGRERLRRAGLKAMLWWMLAEKDGETHVLTFDNTGATAILDSPDVEIVEGSVLLSASAITQGLNQAFQQEKFLLPLAGAVCLLLLALCFRKPALVLLSSLPPLFGLAAVICWLFIAGKPLTLAGAAALILVIGLGADYGIVMLHELSSEMSLGAFRSILVSGLTTLAGLGVLMLAKHPVLHTLGGITFFGLLAEMVAVLLIVPFLCKTKQPCPE